MDNKTKKFWSLFKQKSFVDIFNIGGHLDSLLTLLSEPEIDFLLTKNVVFIRSSSPSSTINIPKIEVTGELNLINFDHGCYKQLLPEESIAIVLHEIGHLFNPEIKGIEGEYAADAYAASKGDYAKWIVSSLQKGLKYKWMGFEAESCAKRINKLKEQSDNPVKDNL